MATLEEILSGMSDVEDDTPVTEEGAPENSSFKQLRDHAKKQEKQLKGVAKELEDLREFKATVVQEQTSNQVRSAFKEAGLNEKHADLFLKVNEGDITADKITAFVTEYGLGSPAAPAAAGAPAAPAAPATPAFAPTAAPVGASQPGTAKLSRPEFDQLRKTDPAAATQALLEGRVVFTNPAANALAERAAQAAQAR